MRNRLTLIVVALLCGCPADSGSPADAGSKTGETSKTPRRSCFDHYPHARVERDGFLLEMSRVRVLTEKEFVREPHFAADGDVKGVATPPPYYIALDVIVHQVPEGVVLSATHSMKVAFAGKEAKLGGWSQKLSGPGMGVGKGGGERMILLAAKLEPVAHGGSPLQVTLEFKHRGDAKKTETFVFEVDVPKERWFWAD